MEQFVIDASIPTSYELKFAPHSHQGHNILAAMSGRDIQIFEMKKDESITGGFSQKYKLRSFYEIEQAQTFEWSRYKNHMSIAVAHQKGKISLVNVNHHQLQSQQLLGGVAGSKLTYQGRVEKEFFTRSMYQNSRQSKKWQIIFNENLYFIKKY